MKRYVSLLLILTIIILLCGCGLMTPKSSACREKAIESIQQDGCWHASIVVKGSTEGGGDFTAEGESDITVAGDQYKTQGYLRIYGTYLSMEQQFDVITDTVANTRLTKANRHNMYLRDTTPTLFTDDLTAVFQQEKSSGHFTNRTAKFEDKDCYVTNCSLSDPVIINDFFPCNTKKVIGKHYTDDIAALNVKFGYDEEGILAGIELSCSGTIAIKAIIKRTENGAQIETPENIQELEDPKSQPLIYGWNMYFSEGETPLEVVKKEPAPETVRMAQERGNTGCIIAIEDQLVELPCKLSELERAGFAMTGSDRVKPGKVREYSLKRSNGDTLIASVYNDKDSDVDCREATVLGLMIASEEVKNTAFVFPCGIQFGDSESKATAAYGAPAYREEIDDTGLFILSYYQIDELMDVNISFYNDHVDEVEIGLHSYR